MLPKTFHIDLPSDLSNEVLKCKSDEDAELVGTEWLLEQSRDLKKNGVHVLHYYTVGKSDAVTKVVGKLF
jgi:methylenetetrahydrofolate reductase (NADPH)